MFFGFFFDVFPGLELTVSHLEFNPDIVNMQILMVGNKSDLESIREVTTREATTFSKKEGLNFLETSAKDGANVLKAFQIIMQGNILPHTVFVCSYSIH